ncbi:MAG: hypothetical protein RI996_25 [Candidatus Parcubacteria bacterium]|jgi:uncharacterized membrane protein YuzA (DUF378 family)
MKNLNSFDWVALVLLIIGGINWGAIAIFNIDLVQILFGEMTYLTRVVYGIVGASALYVIYLLSIKTQ